MDRTTTKYPSQYMAIELGEHILPGNRKSADIEYYSDWAAVNGRTEELRKLGFIALQMSYQGEDEVCGWTCFRELEGKEEVINIEIVRNRPCGHSVLSGKN